LNSDERAIRDVIATWMRASLDGDNDAVLSLVSDDVVFLGPGRPAFGKKEFAAAQDGLEAYRVEGTSDIREVYVSGDLGYAWTELTVSITPRAGGEAVRRSGPTLTIFRRRADGRWVLARDANMLTRQS
jgi:uncharacterized protein (TIGR02246 family)